MAMKLAAIVANRVDQLALPVDLWDISFLYFMNLYVEAPVLMDLHCVLQTSHHILDYIDIKLYLRQRDVFGLEIEIPTVAGGYVQRWCYLEPELTEGNADARYFIVDYLFSAPMK